MSNFDRENPVFFYAVEGLGGVCLNPNGLELDEGSAYEEGAKELFDYVAANNMKLFQGRSYRVLTKEKFLEEYGEEEDCCYP